MSTRLYVGNISWNTNDQGLEEAFGAIGTVTSARIITDRETGRSRGFGFVEFDSADDAKRAVEELNGNDLDGRQLVVNEARPREERSGGGGGGGRRY